MSEISIAELEDSAETVYLLGLSRGTSESVREWFLSDAFKHQWMERFDHARFLVIPASCGIGEVVTLNEEEVRELMENE